MAIGFSTITCLPARSDFFVSEAWSTEGVAMMGVDEHVVGEQPIESVP